MVKLIEYNNKHPKISVITPSLNHGRFLRETIESILMQTYKNYEHIVVDGGSTDDTISILKQYPHIRWISEKETDEHAILEAYRKAIAMAQGEYIIQCCVSDGFLNKNWFSKCVDVLDKDNEVSLVWGLTQIMTEEGNLCQIVCEENLYKEPPQKMDFLAYWLAYGRGFPEGNYCVRREVIDICFPQRGSDDPLSINPAWAFLYKFNTLGYLPYFMPIVANYGRQHKDQRGIRLYEIEDVASHRYIEAIRRYKKELLKGKIKHQFRNGLSEVIKELAQKDIGPLRKQIRKHYIRYKLRKRLKEILDHI